MNWLNIIMAIAPRAKPSIAQGLASAMPGMVEEFALNNPLRQAHFLSQLAHESAGFKTTVEYASGAAYEGRRDLGNTQSGDGRRFKGRGLIQLTGRANYLAASKALGVDFVSNPTLAAEFPAAVRVAGWYWRTRKLNPLADADNARAITKKINGGLNGFEDRLTYLAKAKAAIAIEARKRPATPQEPNPATPAPEPALPAPAQPEAAEPALAKPWWHEWPILRPIGQALTGLGISAGALLDADWKVIATIGGLVVVGIAAFAIVNQMKRRAK